MKILVLSDTHIKEKGKKLPGRLLNEAKTADLIIHAGDWQCLEVFHTLSAFAKTVGVYGNVDGTEIKERMPPKKIIVANGFKIGVVHGHGKGKTTEGRAIEAFTSEEVDCIIYGHSHIPVHKYVGKLLLLNPGSPTDKRRQKQFSYGLININKTINAELVLFD